MNAKLTTLLSLTLLLVGLPLTSLADDDTFSIARDKTLAGKRVTGACLPFAQDLYARLTQAGGEAHLITFNWRSPSGQMGVHAMVVYRDKEGRYWAMDNLQSSPLWLAGTSPSAWVAFFAPRYDVEVKYHKTNPALAGQYADRSRQVSPVRPAVLVAQN